MGTLQSSPGYALLTTPIKQPHTQSGSLLALHRQTFRTGNSFLITGTYNFKHYIYKYHLYIRVVHSPGVLFLALIRSPKPKITLNSFEWTTCTGNSCRERALGAQERAIAAVRSASS